MLALSATHVVARGAEVRRVGKIRRALLRRVVPAHASSGSDGPKPLGRVLVLGGTGFVGSRICLELLEAGYDVTSISRRGTPPISNDGDVNPASESRAARLRASVDWRVGDASEPETARDVLNEGGYVGVVHAVGMLLASDLNALASGSGSIPDADATYDRVTRVTACNAADAAVQCVSIETAARGDGEESSPPPPFVFVSAAEARWDFTAPFDWLEEYLVAKRAVERRLTTLNEDNKLPGCDLRSCTRLKNRRRYPPSRRSSWEMRSGFPSWIDPSLSTRSRARRSERCRTGRRRGVWITEKWSGSRA